MLYKTFQNACHSLQDSEISHLMHIISVVLDSKHHGDNFQPVFVAKMAEFHMKVFTIFEKLVLRTKGLFYRCRQSVQLGNVGWAFRR